MWLKALRPEAFRHTKPADVACIIESLRVSGGRPFTPSPLDPSLGVVCVVITSASQGADFGLAHRRQATGTIGAQYISRARDYTGDTPDNASQSGRPSVKNRCEDQVDPLHQSPLARR